MGLDVYIILLYINRNDLPFCTLCQNTSYAHYTHIMQFGLWD